MPCLSEIDEQGIIAFWKNLRHNDKKQCERS